MVQCIFTRDGLMRSVITSIFHIALLSALLYPQEWQFDKSPTRQNLARLDMLSRNSGWAVSYDGLILKYVDGNWVISDSLTYMGLKTYQGVERKITTLKNWGDIYTVCMFDEHNGWLALNNTELHLHALLRYQNSKWNPETITFPLRIRAIDFLNRDFGFAAGEGGAYKYENREWSPVILPTTIDFRAVKIFNKNQIYLAGESGIVLYFNGQWQTLQTPSSELLRDMDFLSPVLGWFVGDNGTIIRYKENEFKIEYTGTSENLWAVDMLSEKSGFAVGKNGIILRYNGNSWDKLPFITDADLHDLEMIDSSKGWIVGAWGNILKYSIEVQDSVSIPHNFLFYDKIHAGSGNLMDKIDNVHGVLTTDFNGDLLPDLYLTCYLKLNHLLLNNGKGYYKDYSIESGTGGSIETRDNEQKYERGSFAADFDRDNDTDLLIVGEVGATRLLANNGLAIFTDKTKSSDLPDDLDIISGTIWDCNEDGYPDFALIDKKKGLRIILNKKYNRFSELNIDIPVLSRTGLRTLVAGDFNDDNHTDLLIFFRNDKPLLIENNGNAEFVESKTNIIDGNVSNFISSVSLADFNNDGYSDLFICTENGKDGIYIFDPEKNHFTDVTSEWGVYQYGKSYTAVTGDFNLDGFIDVLVSRTDADLLYINNNGSSFNETSKSAIHSKTGYLSGFNTGAASLDIDSDGDLDVVVGNRDHWSSLLENSIENRNWITIKLVGCEDTFEALGAKIHLHDSDTGKLIAYKQIMPTNGYFSQNMNAMNTGVGHSSHVDVHIRYTNGEEKVLRNVETGRELTVQQGTMVVRSIYKFSRATMQFFHIPKIPFELLKIVLLMLIIISSVKFIENRYDWRYSNIVIYIMGTIVVYSSLTFPFFLSDGLVYHLLPFMVLFIILLLLVSVNEQIRKKNIEQNQKLNKIQQASTDLTKNVDMNHAISIVVKTIEFLYPYKYLVVYLYYPFGNYFICHKSDKIHIESKDRLFSVHRDFITKMTHMKSPTLNQKYFSSLPDISFLNDQPLIFPMAKKQDFFGLVLMCKNDMDAEIPESVIYDIKYLILQLTNSISNLKIMENMRDQQQLYAIGTFSSSVLHNLKNPVDGLRMILEVLRNSEIDKKDPNWVHIDDLYEGVLKLKKELLSSFDFGKNKAIINDKIDINKLIKEIINDFEKLDYPPIKLRLGKNLGFINGDKEQILKALENLIENALQASYFSHPVEISTCKVYNNVHVDILDYGKGISVDKMKNLFKMYYSTHGDGRGLGLMITKDIIERHGGFIDLKSSEKDGTLFKLTLPIS